jgi:1-acyl-sn-glycerol-3-phosphate acyltransferase
MHATPTRTLVSVWSWFVLGVVVIIWTPLVALTRLVTLPFDKQAYWAGYLWRKLGWTHSNLTPGWEFKVTGDLPADIRKKPYVVVANHESFVDILLICHVRTEMKWMSKTDFFRYPLVGWMMRLARDIPLERGDSASGKAAIAASRERLSTGANVMIFPEGTRSVTGEVSNFRAGAFNLAIEEQVPVLPLVVHGTREAIQKHDWRVYPTNAEVRILEPVSTAGMTTDDMPALRDKVREMMLSAQADLRRGYGTAIAPAADDAIAEG